MWGFAVFAVVFLSGFLDVSVTIMDFSKPIIEELLCFDLGHDSAISRNAYAIVERQKDTMAK